MNSATALFIAAALSLFMASVAYSRDYFVAVDGRDANAGSIDQPFATIGRAQKAVAPGDTVYLRGGNYEIKDNQIESRTGIAAHVYNIDKSGRENAPINYFSYRDEKPILDFSTIKPNQRIYVFYVSADWIHFRGLEVTGVQVTVKTHTQSECFENHGSNNIYEQLSMHDGMAIGFYLLNGSNNLILNCDAYRNWDPVSEDGRGGNTDGFGCHPAKGGSGNVFRGDRSWFNSDDGYDCINAHEAVMFDHCWAMYNGYSTTFKSLGDGNGFKAGGYGKTPVSRLPNPIPRNTVQFCLSVRNKASGFYANHHVGGANWFNDSGYRNGTNFNMLERLPDNVTDIPGPGQIMRNNLGFKGGKEVNELDTQKSDVANNYFSLNLPVTSADFQSLDEAQLIQPRQADGTLPEIAFMHLARGSNLIDKGVPIRNAKTGDEFPFVGERPDLGCFEAGMAYEARVSK